MSCCVPFCKKLREERSSRDSILQPVTFHEFPNTEWLRNSWLLAVEMKERDLPEGALVCSQHFQADNFYVTGSGLRKLRSKAIPFRGKRKIVTLDLQVCLICLDTAHTNKMSPMCKYNLTEAYINVTGISMSRIQKFKCEPKLCTECAHRLLNCFKFRDKCLRAHELLSQIAQDQGVLTGQNIKTINRDKNNLTSDIVKYIIEPNHCDLYVSKDDVDSNIDNSEQYDKIKIERNDDPDDDEVDPDVKDETLCVDIDLESNCISGLDASQVSNNGDKHINNENMNGGDAINQDKLQDTKLTSNESVNYDVLESFTKEENLDFDIDDEGEYINEYNDYVMDIDELKNDDRFTDVEMIDDDNNSVDWILDQSVINSGDKAQLKPNFDRTTFIDNTLNPLIVYSGDFKNHYVNSNLETLSQTQEPSKIDNNKNERRNLAENPGNINNVIIENNLIINYHETNANINLKVDRCDDNDVNTEFVNDYNDYITFLNENKNKSTENSINNSGATSNKVYQHSSDKVSLTNVILVKAKTSKPQMNRNIPPKRVKAILSNVKKVKNRLNKQQVALEKVNHANKDEISLSYSKLGKDKVSFNNAKLVIDKVCLNNSKLGKDKVSFNNAKPVKDKVSFNNAKLVIDKVSFNNAKLVIDKVSFNNAKPVKDKVSFNNAKLVIDKVSFNNAKPVKDKVSVGSGKLVKDKVSLNNGKLVKDKVQQQTSLKRFKVTKLSHEEQLAEVKQRMESRNYRNAIFSCTICYKGFVNRNAYSLHLDSHTNKFGQFVCPVCGIHTFTKGTLHLHVKNIHMYEYSCDVCPFVTKHARMAVLHERWHNGIKYTCEHCGMEFSKHTSYMSHIRLKHPSDVVCALCGFSFINPRGLVAHMRKSHRFAKTGQNLDGPLCETCDIRFASTAAYEQHVGVSPKHTNGDPRKRTNHYCNTDKRIAVCEKCGVQVKGSLGLYQHKRNHHTIQHGKCQESAICEHCGRVCLDQLHLRRHLLKHSNKRFQCDICQKSFTLKVNLAIHLGTHCASRPQYECTDCGRGFTYKQNMQRHMVSAHSEKPPLYKCKICDKSMTTVKSRDSHILHVHNKVPRPQRLRRPRKPQGLQDK